MGIYNCEETLAESLDSLLNQSFRDFEVIMCDDGSIDNTLRIAKNYCDRWPERFKLILNEKNKGLNFTLNRCLSRATGEYIARMDGDDISLPQRFSLQVMFLDENPEFSIVSSPMLYFDETGVWGKGNSIEKPSKVDYIKGTPFAHGPCMVRREAYEAVGGYTIDDSLLRVEDYHLWIKMGEKGLFGYNLQKHLYMMRDDKNAEKRRNFRGRLNEAHVKYLAFKKLKLPYRYIFFVVKPILIGVLPKVFYRYLHSNRLK